MLSRAARNSVRRHRGIRLLFGMNTGLALVLSLALLVLVNFLAQRNSPVWRIPLETPEEVPAGIRSLLETVSEPLEVTLLLHRDAAAFGVARHAVSRVGTLRENVSSQWIDPFLHPQRARSFFEDHSLQRLPALVLSSGDQKGVFPIRPSMAAADAGAAAFHAFLQASLLAFLQDTPPVLYVLSGHGEASLDDPDPYAGLSRLRSVLLRQAVDLRPLNLAEAGAVPRDCDALLILNPKRSLPDPEAEAIDEYLREEGRALILLDGAAGPVPERVLSAWGVEVADAVATDPTRSLSGRELYPVVQTNHPVGRAVRDLSLVLIEPLVIQPLKPDGAARADEAAVEPLLTTSDAGWGETEERDGSAAFDEGYDLEGPVPIAVAVEKGRVERMDMEIAPTRLVVVGDIDFVSNQSMAAGNADFAAAALNWVLGRGEIVQPLDPAVEDSAILLSRRDLMTAALWCVGLFPGAALLMTALVYFIRRT